MPEWAPAFGHPVLPPVRFRNAHSPARGPESGSLPSSRVVRRDPCVPPRMWASSGTPASEWRGMGGKYGHVADTAYVGRQAYVFDFAQVLDRASVDGSAWVRGNAVVIDNARVRGDSVVDDDAQISGDALIAQNAFVHGKADVRDASVVSGSATVTGKVDPLGYAGLDGKNGEVRDTTIGGPGPIRKLTPPDVPRRVRRAGMSTPGDVGGGTTSEVGFEPTPPQQQANHEAALALIDESLGSRKPRHRELGVRLPIRSCEIHFARPTAGQWRMETRP